MGNGKKLMLINILNDDWSLYDAKKTNLKQEVQEFLSDEEWEIDFLINLLYKYFPKHSKYALMKVVLQCGMIKYDKCKREDLIKLILSKLL